MYIGVISMRYASRDLEVSQEQTAVSSIKEKLQGLRS